MAKRIQYIVKQVEFYLGKQESGYHSPEVITRELNTESLNLFEELIEKYAKTRQISEHLQPFSVTTDPFDVPDSGKEPKPSDFEHADVLYLEDGTEVDILESAMFIPRLKHPNKPPSKDFPICRMVGSNIEFKPTDIDQKAILTYFKTPTEAKYDFTTVGEDTYEYQDDTSVDWEWSKTMSDKIVIKVLSNFGINLKASDLIQYSQLEDK